MIANNTWAAYGRLADGAFVVEEGRFTFIGTQAGAQQYADRLATDYNEKNPDNPIVRAWPQKLIGDALPEPLVPNPQEPQP